MSASYFKSVAFRPTPSTTPRTELRPPDKIVYRPPSLLERSPVYGQSGFQNVSSNPYLSIAGMRARPGLPSEAAPDFSISPPAGSGPAVGLPPTGSAPDFSISPPAGSAPAVGLPPTGSAPDFSISPPAGSPPLTFLGPTTGPVAVGPGPASGSTQLDVPFYSQFESGHGFTPGDTACFNASVAMAKAGGATVLGSDQRIQVGISEDTKGHLTVDPQKAAEGRSYIDSELAAGRPVVVGVSDKDSDYNVDKLTDHFVTITGKGVDENGKTFYTFNDPGTSHANLGDGTQNPNNRFFVDDTTGALYKPGADSGYTVDRRFDVAMVRENAESR